MTSEEDHPQRDFRTDEFVVYPAHGVGGSAASRGRTSPGQLELFVISFDKDKMTLRVPTAKAEAVGHAPARRPRHRRRRLKT